MRPDIQKALNEGARLAPQNVGGVLRLVIHSVHDGDAVQPCVAISERDAAELTRSKWIRKSA